MSGNAEKRQFLGELLPVFLALDDSDYYASELFERILNWPDPGEDDLGFLSLFPTELLTPVRARDTRLWARLWAAVVGTEKLQRKRAVYLLKHLYSVASKSQQFEVRLNPPHRSEYYNGATAAHFWPIWFTLHETMEGFTTSLIHENWPQITQLYTVDTAGSVAHLPWIEALWFR
jgi:hypothetical protein